jgi:chromate transporter
MLLPGPEAQQLAVYVGWLLHRTLGGLVAGIFFVLPGFLFMLGLSWLYAVHGNVREVATVFYGLRAAVIAIVAAAVIRIGSKALKNRVMVAIAAIAFIAIFFLKAPFPMIVIGAGFLGFIGGQLWPKTFSIVQGHGGGKEDDPTIIRDDLPPAEHTRPTFRRSIVAMAIWLAAWWGSLAAVIVWRGWHDVLSQEAIFFSKAAMVTFGGAYAVLAYIAQAAVQYGWLEPSQMLDGLGLAESTPGPLILVTEFVGFLGAFRNPGDLSPVLAGVFGATVTTWVTFAPSFLWIFLGAPFIEHLRGNVLLSAALSTITAAVVGVILNLAVWLGLHTLFRTVTEKVILSVTAPVPQLNTLDPFTLVLAGIAFVGMWRFKWGIIPVVAGSGIVGLLYR